MLKLHQFNRDDIIEYTMVKVEGATFTNDKADNGGKTKWGIIEKTALKYKSVWKLFGWDGNMATLPKALAKYIYVDMFWNKLSLDAISILSPLLAERLFCIAVNRGARVAGRYLQRLLNVFNNGGKYYPDIDVDGLINPQGATVKALEAFLRRRGWEGLKNLIFDIAGLQTTGYITISENNETQERFTFGWSERVTNGVESIYRIIFDAEDTGKTKMLIGV